MRRRFTLPMIAFILMTAFELQAAMAAGRIEAKLALSTDPRAPSPATIVVTLTNTGDAPVNVFRWWTPFAAPDGRLPQPVFDLTDDTGKPVRYMGRRVNTGAVRLAHFIQVAPGETLEREVDLTKEYDFIRAGWYDIRFDLHLETSLDPKRAPLDELERFVPNAQGIVSTNRVRFLLRNPIPWIRRAPDEVASLTCDVEQSVDIESARIGARADATRAERFLNTMIYVYEFTGDDFVLTFRPHPRYSRWFGTHDPSEPMPEDPGWGAGDNAQVKRTIETAALRLVNGVISPTCGCSPGYEDTMAWAEDHTPYNIHFCKKFFDAYSDGRDSRRSAVYHEMTHFFDHRLDGRSDYSFVTNQESAKNLATTNRSHAVRSALNYEYFVTDTSNREEAEER
ncbi:M35 family metallo-endopeptidase [Luteibacter yeojuensis]|uniref:Lysine-specific metallo-endopeptidase domain-containing protein n=1 Tax=Luteibacter yeojuensis TaxID=345309 RepID=A0A7X5TPD0_9GAMM|nr:M35 family metallo-endopeptidase [Luteibacter yeojuensis]NID14930.1 hypothetical protein [Luteibacter yeojuensis]